MRQQDQEAFKFVLAITLCEIEHGVAAAQELAERLINTTFRGDLIDLCLSYIHNGEFSHV